MSGGVVYHWKHGWIPLDHAAALSHAKGNHDAAKAMLSGIPREHLSRSPHIMAARAPRGRIALLDKRTGETASMAEHHAASLHSQGHTVTHITGGLVHTRDDGGTSHAYNPSTGHADEHATAQAQAQDARNNANAVARTTPTPSAADLSLAATKWRQDHPGQKVAGNEREIRRIADELWRAKRSQGTNTSATPAQAAAESHRVKQAADHMRQMRAMGLDRITPVR